MMKCSGCASVNVCRFVGDMKLAEDQVKDIRTNESPFSIAISCKYFNEDKRTKGFSLLQQQQTQSQSYTREDIVGV